MKQYAKNPRRITPKQLEQLKANIQELGDLSGIVHDLNTDEIITGNQRSRVIDINKCEVVITEKYDKPTPQGTVAWGYIIFEGQKLNYRQVCWSDQQRAKACITANALGGDWDYEVLKSDWKEESEMLDGWGLDVGGVFNIFNSGQEKERKEGYSTKIETPIYEPKNEKPTFDKMVNLDQYNKLIEEINASNVPEEAKTFLRIAASRHIVFNYEEIANYYANVGADIQRLMENSALVIIDFNRALELGYIKFAEYIAKKYEEEYENAK